MKNYENTFVRGPSPSYSDDGPSAFSSIQTNNAQYNPENYSDEKLQDIYVGNVKQGRNTFAFWTVVIILLVLTVGNLIITLTIISVLHLGKGIHGMELIPEEEIIKFYGSTDLDRIYSKNIAQIDGFSDVPVTLAAEHGGSVHIRLHHRNGQTYNRLSMDENGIQFRAINTFEIKDPTNGNTIFTTHRPQYNMPMGAETLQTKTISASRITSPLKKSMSITADGHVGIKGSEGIFIDGANILLQAEHSITVNGTQTMLEGGAGIFLDMDKIPIVSAEFGLRTGSVQYKICVCMPQGTLFRIPIPRVHNGPKITCAHFNTAVDPCAVN